MSVVTVKRRRATIYSGLQPDLHSLDREVIIGMMLEVL